MDVLLILALSAFTIGCEGEPASEPAARAPEAPVAAGEEADPPAGEGPTITPFGVPECDAYVQKYVDCVETRVTGEEKDRLLQGFEANRTKWRTLAAMREGALALGMACKAATQKAKEELSVDYGCEF